MMTVLVGGSGASLLSIFDRVFSVFCISFVSTLQSFRFGLALNGSSKERGTGDISAAARVLRPANEKENILIFKSIQ